MGTAGALLRAARPGQWTKNLLVFAAPVAAGAATEPDIAGRALLAFITFCAASAGTYLLNDARDAEADRLHPTKRHRPVAAGHITVPMAFGMGAVLVVAAVVAGFIIAPGLGVTVAGYLIITTAYSFGLKTIAVVELVAVSAGFVLRAVAGAAATDLPLSTWFFIVTSAGALLVITGKREAELRRFTAAAPAGADASDTAITTRKVLGEYTHSFLSSVRAIAAGLMLVAYCLWAFEGADEAGSFVALQLSVVPFAVAVLRFVQLADAGDAERPERLVFGDRVLLTAGIVWAMIYGYGIYVA